MTQAATTSRDPTPASAPKRVSEEVTQAPATNREATVASAPKTTRAGLRRFILMVAIPAVLVVGGVYWWLTGGRYISTDNAYVGADKAMITPYVTGPIVAIHVKEGQILKVGDPLFDIDPAPFQTALAIARSRVEAAKIGFANLKAQYVSNIEQIRMGERSVQLHQSDFDRKHQLAESRSGSLADQDTSSMALV